MRILSCQCQYTLGGGSCCLDSISKSKVAMQSNLEVAVMKSASNLNLMSIPLTSCLSTAYHLASLHVLLCDIFLHSTYTGNYG